MRITLKTTCFFVVFFLASRRTFSSPIGEEEEAEEEKRPLPTAHASPTPTGKSLVKAFQKEFTSSHSSIIFLFQNSLSVSLSGQLADLLGPPVLSSSCFARFAPSSSSLSIHGPRSCNPPLPRRSPYHSSRCFSSSSSFLSFSRSLRNTRVRGQTKAPRPRFFTSPRDAPPVLSALSSSLSPSDFFFFFFVSVLIGSVLTLRGRKRRKDSSPSLLQTCLSLGPFNLKRRRK